MIADHGRLQALEEVLGLRHGQPETVDRGKVRGAVERRDALRMAWFRRHPERGLIFHSDRGSQYCSHDFQAALKGYGMLSSMSRKGNGWDNAPTESLWGSMKVGRLYGKRFATHRDAMDEVIDWLTFYNHRRLHSTLGYISPMKFEANWHAGQVKKAA